MRFESFAALVNSGVPAAVALRESGVQQESEFELLSFAMQSGAPLVPVALAIATHKENQQAVEREIAQAQAIPKATRRLMLWLPALGLVMAEGLGFGTIDALRTTFGLLAFLTALALIYLGASITQRMLNRLQTSEPFPGEGWFRLGLLLAAGSPLSRAIEQANLGLAAEPILNLARETGASLAGLIAAQQRYELANHATAKVTQAKSLAVSLLIPLGLTTLPAFLIFTIVPMLIGIANQ